ncbi:MAG TPA: AIR synthase-related protein, partial [bacterium]
AAALARTGLATATLDISDGLSRDLARLCAASRVGATVEAGALPVTGGTRRAAALLGRDPSEAALHGGEEYELLFAARPGNAAKIAALGRRLELAVTRIGAVTARGSGIEVVEPGGRRGPLVPRTWEHF